MIPTPPTLEIFSIWVWWGWSSERNDEAHLLLTRYEIVIQEQTVPEKIKIKSKVQTMLEGAHFNSINTYKMNIIVITIKPNITKALAIK